MKVFYLFFVGILYVKRGVINILSNVIMKISINFNVFFIIHMYYKSRHKSKYEFLHFLNSFREKNDALIVFSMMWIDYNILGVDN